MSEIDQQRYWKHIPTAGISGGNRIGVRIRVRIWPSTRLFLLRLCFWTRRLNFNSPLFSQSNLVFVLLQIFIHRELINLTKMCFIKCVNRYGHKRYLAEQDYRARRWTRPTCSQANRIDPLRSVWIVSSAQTVAKYNHKDRRQIQPDWCDKLNKWLILKWLARFDWPVSVRNGGWFEKLTIRVYPWLVNRFANQTASQSGWLDKFITFLYTA